MGFFSPSHIPHVMTLFDRRVDLALFSPDTPLYVMCRDWMSNNPLKTASSNSAHELRPSNKPLPSHYPNTLPLPAPLLRDKGGVVIRLDMPKPHPPHTKDRKELDTVLNEVRFFCE